MNLRDHYKNYYTEQNGSDWRELSARYKAENIIKLYTSAGSSIAPNMVELGCGDGAIARELERMGFGKTYVGYEISDSAIAKAQARNYDNPTKFKLFDGVRTDAEAKSFDLVIVSHVLEHVEDPRILLREAARLSNNVFIEVPLELNIRTSRDFRWTSTGHINLYNPIVIRHLVQSTGLQIQSEQVTCAGLPVFTFQRSKLRGIVHWAIKSMILRFMPSVAWRLFTYHGSLLATPGELNLTTEN